MGAKDVTGTGNQILAGLNAREHDILRPHLVLVPLEAGVVLGEAGQPADFVYFPTETVLSLVGATESGATVEVAVVGYEGVASVSTLLGRNRLPFRIVVQVAGHAWRLPTAIAARQLRDCAELHERLLVYSETVIFQVGQSAICNRFHNAKQRLARWLLMLVDRSGTRQLPLTHEFIANMVGGPRSAVTEAALALRDAGAIDYGRGTLTVKNLVKLQQEACECYAALKALMNK